MVKVTQAPHTNSAPQRTRHPPTAPPLPSSTCRPYRRTFIAAVDLPARANFPRHIYRCDVPHIKNDAVPMRVTRPTGTYVFTIYVQDSGGRHKKLEKQNFHAVRRAGLLLVEAALPLRPPPSPLPGVCFLRGGGGGTPPKHAAAEPRE